MKILIIEDATLVAKRIESLCVAAFANAKCDIAFDIESALTHIQQFTYDLIYLDLNLNGSHGFELLNSKSVDPTKVIIVTAYQDQAAMAFEFAVFDFICKPIKKSRFLHVAQRAINAMPHDAELIKINHAKKEYSISLSDIYYIKAEGNYSQINTIKGTQLLSDKTMHYFESTFDSLFRIHRTYLVKRALIESITKLGAGQYRVTLLNGLQLPMSRGAYKHFNKK